MAETKQKQKKKVSKSYQLPKPVKRSKNPLGVTAKEHGVMLMHLIARHKETGKPLSEFKRDIPYFIPDFRKETQIVEARLYYLSDVNTVAATAFTTVTSFTAAGFNNFSDFASIFDEYRLGKVGKVSYTPVTYVNVNGTFAIDCGFCIACIDYGVSSANGSQLAAWSHDNKQMFYLVSHPGATQSKGNYGKEGRAHWTVEPEPLPDQDWIPSTTSNTVFYYWKPYMAAASSPGTGKVGVLLGWHDFQFRGMAA